METDISIRVSAVWIIYIQDIEWRLRQELPHRVPQGPACSLPYGQQPLTIGNELSRERAVGIFRSVTLDRGYGKSRPVTEKSRPGHFPCSIGPVTAPACRRS
ncbi:hypothetical protein GAZ87_08570 [Phocaeicola vulgatus]|nr:hypothetical protein GAZ81_07285 [Phocaeicola vulgatus]KAB6608651.1 hypothetical protein GAZ67_09135 [Phocaeicola vulgatus]KAB6611869.1 hypothetical protein GAZ74_08980 [Phocaeicola vulgatus]KAB6624086.1 hypothetical protein GAZ87_08570 [Phocaeicola vulgatus]KAB6637179.1 hypothetical protein GAY16_09695 [Phocaeicola vulgatus]